MGMREVVTLRALRSFRLPSGVTTGVTIGFACGLVSGFFYGTWNVVAKYAVSGFGIPPLVFATIAFFFGSIMFLPLVGRTLPKTVMSAPRSAVFFILSGLGSGCAIIALAFALERGDVVVISPIVSVSPLITLVLAWVLLRQLERITLTLVMGALMVVGGVVLVAIGDNL